MKLYIKPKLLTTLLAMLLISLFTMLSIEKAKAVSWADGEHEVYKVKSVKEIPEDYCNTYYLKAKINDDTLKNLCISSGVDLTFATYRDKYFVKFRGDVNFSSLASVCDDIKACHYVPAKDMLVTKQIVPNSPLSSKDRLVIYKNFSKKLYLHFNIYLNRYEYRFNENETDFVYLDRNNNTRLIKSIKVSQNGEWLVLEYPSKGIATMNLNNFEIKQISTYTAPYGIGRNPQIEFAISDKGDALFVGGVNSDSRLVLLTPGCGITPIEPDGFLIKPDEKIRCKSYNLADNKNISNLIQSFQPKFLLKDNILRFFYIDKFGLSYELTLSKYGFIPNKLDYLALGDSFTSGEGDTDDYYLEGTNAIGEKCHLSKRSYPYLLKTSLQINSSLMQSVACSGARTKDITSDRTMYWGQGDRLKNMFGDNISMKMSAQDRAYDTFLPGRIGQLEFVSTYQPSIATIGISGNDAGFMDKVKTCMMPGKTCEWASSKRYATAEEVKSLRSKLVGLYNQLHNESPNTKLYAVGYPQIIDPDGTCDTVTSMMFDSTEKVYIKESLILLNDVIESAANDAGITYLDIEDSYGDQTLCGSDAAKAFNSLQVGDDIAPIEKLPELVLIGAESFHPNATGHRLVADKITSMYGNLLIYDGCDDGSVVCPRSNQPEVSLGSFWNNLTDDGRTYRNDLFLSAKIILMNQSISISLGDRYFEPGSTVKVELHSDDAELGTLTAGNDGSLSGNFAVPAEVGIGYHTVHLIGTSYSGEPIDVYEVVAISPVPLTSGTDIVSPVTPTTPSSSISSSPSLSSVGITPVSSNRSIQALPGSQMVDNESVLGSEIAVINDPASQATSDIKGDTVVTPVSVKDAGPIGPSNILIILGIMVGLTFIGWGVWRLIRR